MTWAMQELWRDWGMLAMLELGFGGKLGKLGDARAGLKQIWGKKKKKEQPETLAEAVAFEMKQQDLEKL